MMHAANVNTLHDLASWLNARRLRLQVRRGRGDSRVHIAVLRPLMQNNLTAPLIVGTSFDWKTAILDALYKFEAETQHADMV